MDSVDDSGLGLGATAHQGLDVPAPPTHVDGCYACERNAQLEDLPPREAIVVRDGWRVAHAFDSALPGWLVLIPTRHVTAADELDEEEIAALGPLLAGLSGALRTVTGCTKTYFMLFAEKEGFEHLHVHVVPRMSWFTDEQVGPGVLGFLSRPESEWVSESAQDEVALELRDLVPPQLV